MGRSKTKSARHSRRPEDEGARVAELIASVITSNIILNICLPHAVLRFNNASPVVVGTDWLAKDTLHAFINKQVSPFFEPIWLRLDKTDLAPDGNSQQMYKDRTLDLLTEAVDN